MNRVISNIFDNIGDTIKKIAKVLFCICLICGIISLAIGLVGYVSAILDSVDFDMSWNHDTFSEALESTIEDVLNLNVTGITEIWQQNLYMWGVIPLNIGFSAVLGAVAMIVLYALGELVCSSRDTKKYIAELVNKGKEG